MIAKRKKSDAPADFSNHVLFALELQIARRADELAKTAPLIRDQNLEIWLRAERDVLRRLSRLGRNHSAAVAAEGGRRAIHAV